MTNLEIAKLLRQVAAAYQILNVNRFRIIAYERAADSIEHLTSEAKDLWDDGKLAEIPGVGETITGHLDELFRTGRVKHFEQTMKKIPPAVFPLLSVPGIGPKRAYALVTELKLKSEKTVIPDLIKAAQIHKIANLPHFGDKSEAEILINIEIYKRGQIKEKRILLSEADEMAQKIIEYLNKDHNITQIDALGSLRRRVSTIGDIDIAVVTNKPELSIAHFCKFPHKKVIEKGPTGASLLLVNGRQVDLRIADAASYGAMLQYFTGSKNHNIKLRTYALTKGLSLSEYGIKIMHNAKLIMHNNKNKILTFDSEEKFYEYLGMQWVAPELREDMGEVEKAISHTLPKLVEPTDIKGDLHVHTSYDLQPSHDLGVNSIIELLDYSQKLGYEYLGISDHNPSVGNHTEKEIVGIMKRRKEYYEQQYSSWIKNKNNRVQMLIMLEVDIDPDGKLALPAEAFNYVDAVMASVHSSFRQTKSEMTDRLKKALLANPKVKMLGHPIGRLLGQREGYEADWQEIFKICFEANIAMEINASPYRLDLPDTMVYDARASGVKLVINTDSHQKEAMDMMKYGVSVARRGWCTKRDIINTLEYSEIQKWFLK